jgi:carboxymethylenebutenolidase
MGEMISFSNPEGKTCAGYLAKSSGQRAVVILQEWWGLNDQIKGVADRYAAAGFTALAPDLYDGRVTAEEDEASHMMSGLDWVGATEQDVRGAAQYLKSNGNATVGVLGFCMGGALTIIACAKVPEVDAGVCYYGIPPAEAADPANIRVPLQGHFADRDDWCTPAAADALEAQLKGAGVTHDFYRYACQHGFFNEVRPRVYDAAAAALAFDRSVEFLGKHL